MQDFGKIKILTQPKIVSWQKDEDRDGSKLQNLRLNLILKHQLKFQTNLYSIIIF